MLSVPRITWIAVLISFVGVVWIITAGPPDDPTSLPPTVQAKSDLASASRACAMYREEIGHWPQGWSDLQDFLGQELRDPWSRREYVWFQRTGEPPIFMSWGADRLPGGVGLDTDIVERSAFDARRDEIRELRRSPKISPPTHHPVGN